MSPPTMYAANLRPLDQPAGRPPIADTRLEFVDNAGWTVTIEYADGTTSTHPANELIEL